MALERRRRHQTKIEAVLSVRLEQQAVWEAPRRCCFGKGRRIQRHLVQAHEHRRVTSDARAERGQPLRCCRGVDVPVEGHRGSVFLHDGQSSAEALPAVPAGRGRSYLHGAVDEEQAEKQQDESDQRLLQEHVASAPNLTRGRPSFVDLGPRYAPRYRL